MGREGKQGLMASRDHASGVSAACDPDGSALIPAQVKLAVDYVREWPRSFGVRVSDKEAAEVVADIQELLGQGGREWFWRIVDEHGLADVPSDEEAALRMIIKAAQQ